MLYDAGNSAYGTIIVTAYYILYFKNVVVGDPHQGDFFWGLAVGLSMLALAILAPLLGGMADEGGARKWIFGFLTWLCVISTAGLAGIGPGMILSGSLLFALSLFAYEGAIIFYDSFLRDISPAHKIGKISGSGFAVGYAGGVLSLAFAYPFLQGEEGTVWSTWPVFLAALQFLILALPALIFLPGSTPAPGRRLWVLLGQGKKRALKTLKQVRKFPDLCRLLIAFFLYYNGIATVISFAAAFAHDTYGFSPSETMIVILFSNTIAIPGAILGGRLTDQWGGRKTILLSLLLWILAIVLLLSLTAQFWFYVIGGLVGIGLGTTQGATRALYAQFVPPGQEAQLFSFRGICGKFSAVLGPILFGAVSYLTHSQRWAASVLLLFFIAGFVMIYTVKEERGWKQGRWSP